MTWERLYFNYSRFSNFKNKGDLTMTAPQEITFQEMIAQSAQPVLVDFWAPWCGPCRLLSPVIEGLAEEYADQVRVLKVNVDEQPTLASQYNITGIPTVILFNQGKIVDRVSGLVPVSTWQQKINLTLNP
jgi:thioredoxin 1